MNIEGFGLRVPRTTLVNSVDDAVKAANRIGYPVAMKISSPGILHKSDVGGVRTMVLDPDQVTSTYHEILMNVKEHSPEAEINGIEVQEMVREGIEIIIGLLQDPQFGMTIMFGLGGIFTEILQDVSFRVLPITPEDAHSMVREIKGAKIFEGYRNQKPVSEEMLVDLLLTVGEKGYEYNQSLESVDLNPVIVWEDQYRVVDSKFILKDESVAEIPYKKPNTSHLEKFFTAGSIAVIGASNSKGKVGNGVLDSLLKHNYQGSVFPVNPRHSEIMGKKAYPDLSSIPEDVDMAVMTTDIKFVPDILSECQTKAVKNLVIISGGGKELGGDSTLLENEIRESGAEADVRMIGPNCTGVFDGRSRIATFFQGHDRMSRPKDGPVAFMTQSGTVGVAFLEDAGVFGVRNYVSYGNRVDVDEADLLEFWGNDPEIKVIGIYVEGFENGRKFLEAAKHVSDRKPIIIYKSARTQQGAKAAASHTGNLGGNYRIVQGALQQAGLITVDSYDELLAGIKVLALQPAARGKNVGMISNGAGSMIQAIDYLSEVGMVLPQLARKSIKRLEDHYPSYYITGNPIDVTGSGTSDDYIYGIQTLLDDPNIDLVMPWFVFVNNPLEEDIVDKMRELIKDAEKPIIVGAFGGKYSLMLIQALEAGGIPTYHSVRDWVTAARIASWKSE